MANVALTEAAYRAALAAFDWTSEWNTTSPGWGTRVDQLKTLSEMRYRIDPKNEIWNTVAPPAYQRRRIFIGLMGNQFQA